MKNTAEKIISAFIAAALLCALFGCSGRTVRTDLMKNITPRPVAPSAAAPSDGDIAGFSVALFRETAAQGENTLISPLSVLIALSMTANGARGDTLSEMEAVLGMDIDGLNSALHDYIGSLTGASGKKCRLSIADSVWFTDDGGFTVSDDFLQLNADYYGADIYRVPFGNAGTLSDINGWVRKNTDGMIDKILDSLPSGVMYLINAIAFDAEWDTAYTKDQLRRGTFTTGDGRVIETGFMDSEESLVISDGRATGFVKYYSGQRYAFAALLPEDGSALSDYIGSLDGEKLCGMLKDPSRETVRVSIPKFSVEYRTEMSDILSGMGMPTAFSASLADFSGLGKSDNGNVFISEVLHKTYLSLDEHGTKAAAVTSVGLKNASAAPSVKTVILDRPFLYMLIDCENGLPLFIGTMYDPGK